MENGVDVNHLLELIENLIAPSGQTAVIDADGWTPRSEQILESAKREAERFSSRQIGTEHLLIAMIKETECAVEADEYVKCQFAKTVCGYIGCHGRRWKPV